MTHVSRKSTVSKQLQHPTICKRTANCIECMQQKQNFVLNNTSWDYFANISLPLKIIKDHEGEVRNKH